MTVSPATPIYTGQDFYVPRFEVKVGARKLDREAVHDITSVSYHDSLDEIDGFEITINNWDAETRSFKYADGSLFDPGKRVELSMGYYGPTPLRLMVTGEITSLDPDFPASGQPTLTIRGLNLLHTLRRKQESHAYTKVKDSDVAKTIAARLNITPDAPNAANEDQHEYLFQDNKYDIVFLLERARRIGYDLFVDEPKDGGDPTLAFKPTSRVRRVTHELTYGRSLIDFNPTLSTARQVAKVTVRGWDNVAKEKIEATAQRSQLSTSRFASGTEDPAGSFADREEIITDRPVNSKAEAETLALETLERIAKDMVTASGSTVGLPDLVTGTAIQVDGVTDRFGGRYFVTGTTHTIGESGYTTSFDCRKEEL
jgi:Bacteriophage probable baseplate hub protein